MSKEDEMRCVVSGSFFKFKDEIDLTIDGLTEVGVTVLAPDKGWLYKPPTRIYSARDKLFRPLPSERWMSIKQIENEFLVSLSKSDFVYVVNPGGYIGASVSMEIGFAIALNIPVYSSEPISIKLDEDPLWKERVGMIKVVTIEEAVLDVKRRKEEVVEEALGLIEKLEIVKVELLKIK